MAGWPVALKIGVNGTKSAERKIPCMGLSAPCRSFRAPGRLGERRRGQNVVLDEELRDLTRDALEILDRQQVVEALRRVPIS